MRHKHFISTFTEYWALLPDHANAYLELVAKHFASADVLNVERPQDFTRGYVQVPAMGSPFYISEFGMVTPVADAPEGSIAIISMCDVITKYDGWCHAGVETKAALLAEADANPNIIGHILIFDTPGGEARAPEKMGQVIDACTKPVFGLIDNLCASAGYWIAAHCDKLFIAGNMAQVGSIGAYTTIIDHTKRLEALGINVIEIYADQSTMKNVEFREALQGKPEKMKQRITEMQSLFEASVRNNRSAQITDETVFNGSLLLGQKAIDAGLVDGMASFNEVVSMVEEAAATLEKTGTTNYYGI